jgi:hypothetical protein
MQNAFLDSSSIHIPKSFKWLIWINIGVAVLQPITIFGFQFFCYGGCPLLTIPLGFIFLFGSMFSVLAFYAMICVDIFFVFRLWKSIKTRVFIPFGILAIGLFAGILSDSFARKLDENHFLKYFDQYENIVSMIKNGNIPSTTGSLPFEYWHLAPIVMIGDSNDPNSFNIVFIVGSAGFAGHTAYIYSNSGIIAKDSQLDKNWRNRKQVKEHWFRATD